MTNRVLRFGQVRSAMQTVSVGHCFGQMASLTRYTVCSLQTCLPSLLRQEQHRYNGTVSTFFKKVKEGIDR